MSTDHYVSDETANKFFIFLLCLVTFVMGAGFMSVCQRQNDYNRRFKNCEKLGGFYMQHIEKRVCYKASSLIEIELP